MTTEKNHEGRRATDYRPEERVVSVLDSLSKREKALTPSVLILILFCVGVVWFAANKLDEYIGSSLTYNQDMIKLVTNIETSLEASNQSNREFQIRIMQIVDRNTLQIARMSTMLDEAGILPLYTDPITDRTYIQQRKNGK